MTDTSKGPKGQKKPEYQPEKFSEPSCEVREGKRIAPTCEIWEPHEYNRKLLASQRARGVAANIPQLPTLGRTHKVAITKPVQLDLVAKAKAMHAAAAEAARELQVQEDVLPDNSIPFEELDS